MKEQLSPTELREHYEWLKRAGTILVNSENFDKWTKGLSYLEEAKRIAKEQGWD